MAIITSLANFARPIINGLEFLGPAVHLGIRLYLANVFWQSGVNKFQSWDSTLFLFEYEYHVPLLSPNVAAYLGTGAELFFPVLLAVGIGGRFAAISLFIFNIIAILRYSAGYLSRITSRSSFHFYNRSIYNYLYLNRCCLPFNIIRR